MGQTAYRCRLLQMLFTGGVTSLALLSAPAALAQKPATERPEVAASEDLQPLDPDQPLAEFPDFGVDWPDLDEGKVQPVSPDSTDATAAETPDQELPEDSRPVEDESAILPLTSGNFQPQDVLADSSYKLRYSGLPPTLGSGFISRFESLSALREYRGDEANFAQIKRRAEADAELFDRLLRFEGYFDAVVATRFAAADDTVDPNDVIITIHTIPGPP
ncbi:MAG: hypothetical protein AAGM33_08105, partial [Pseudomonadota bacterium]